MLMAFEMWWCGDTSYELKRGAKIFMNVVVLDAIDWTLN